MYICICINIRRLPSKEPCRISISLLPPKCFHIRACPSHLKLFIRLADEDAVFRIFAAYVPHSCIATILGIIECLVEGKTQAASLANNGIPKPGTPLANPTCKHECIYLASKRDIIAPNESTDAVHK